MAGRWKGRSARLTAVVLAVGGACAGWTRCALAGSVESPIVFTQLPRQGELEQRPGPAEGTLRGDYGQGGRIVRLEPDGRLRVLTEGFHSACGADVSFDGGRILFAAQRGPDDPWNIWEMNADGTDARQVTRDLGNCRSPAYQAVLYTIVSTEPWYQIMFASDAARAMNEYGSGPATSLYSCKLDGSAVRRLTMNLSDDVDPLLMDDGRVLLASWQRMDLRHGPGGRVSLFGVNTDGTDYALYCGDQGQRVKHMPCATADGLVLFVEADRVGWDGAGQLGCVSVRRNFHTYRPITQGHEVLYHSPSPLPDGAVLVSRRPSDGLGTHGIYRLDPQTGRAELVFDDPDLHDVHARVLAARPQPDGRSSVVNEEHRTGKFYCLNAYLTDPSHQPYVQPGTIQRLRVIEGVPRPAGAAPSDPQRRSDGIPPVVQKRLLGEFAVEEDGSFHLELPADLPVQLQTLDEHGMALRTCGWIWAKHREPRGCIGCHEDPELTPENRFVTALQQPAVQLTLPPERRRTVDFRRDVMPIVTARCAPCHTAEGTAPVLTGDTTGHYNRAYVSLLAAPAGSSEQDRPLAGKYVQPGRARTSPLIWRLFGRNTSRPWDAAYDPGARFEVHPPPPARPLTDDERRTFVEWIDLGGHWDGIPGPDEFTRRVDPGKHGENER